MTERTTVHRLQVATPLARFIDDEVLPGTGIEAAAFWRGFDAIVHDLAPKNAALLAERDRLQPSSTPGTAPPRPDRRHGGLPRLPREDRLPGAGAGQGEGHDEERRRRTGAAGRPAAGGADHQCALCAERRQRALGLAVRRALRHRRAARDGGAEKGSGYNPVRGARSSPTRATCSTAARRWKGSHLDSTAYRVRTARLAVDAEGRPHHRPRTRRSSSASRARWTRRRRCCCRTTGCTWTSASTAARRSAPATPPASATWCSNRAVDHPRPRGLGGGGRRRGQGAGLPQLAGHPATARSPSRSPRAASTFTRGLNPDRRYTGPRGGTWRCTAARCCSCATSAT
jgi:hypothetical protein